jgi:hypothetical protein
MSLSERGGVLPVSFASFPRGKGGSISCENLGAWALPMLAEDLKYIRSTSLSEGLSTAGLGS